MSGSSALVAMLKAHEAARHYGVNRAITVLTKLRIPEGLSGRAHARQTK